MSKREIYLNILLCHNFYQHRGGEDITVSREKEILERNGHKVILFARNSGEIDGLNCFHKISSLFETFFSFSMYIKLKGVIKRERPDVIHAHNIFPLLSPAIYYAAKSCNVPVIQTVHNYRMMCLNGLFLRNNGRICEKCKKGNFAYGVMNRCYRGSFWQSLVMALVLFIHRALRTFKNKIDIFIAPCQFLKDKLIEVGFGPSEICVKPHFTEISANVQLEYFEDYAGYIGRLSPEKGLLTLLKAFKEISGINLKILGEGPLRKSMDEYIYKERIANVSLLGYVKGIEKDEILKKAMFLVLPSECYENMPYSILESFACGVPVIASRIGGLKELVTDCYNGLLFEMGNAEDLVHKIEELVKNKELLLAMRRNARNTAEEKFSEDLGYENLMKVYRSVVSFKK